MPDTQKRGMLNIKKVKGSPYSIIAKFHYMDPTGPDRTVPDQTKSAHFVWYWLNSTTRARPDPTGPARTFFAGRVSEKLLWVRAGLRQSPCGSGRVQSGPCSGI